MHIYASIHKYTPICINIYRHIYITKEQDAESAKASMLTRE